MGRETDKERQKEREGRRERGREGTRHKSLFDWPVVFPKVRLMITNCTLAKWSQKHKM